jgi:lipopolysaccharide export system permease protein
LRILDRLVMGQFLKLFVIGVLATPPLFALGEFTENLDRYKAIGVTGAEMARGYLFRLPEYIVWAFPVAGLIAAVFTVHTMTAHREIVAAKAGGISFRRLTFPIILAGAVLAGVAVALTEVVPRSNRVAFQILQNLDMRLDFRSDFVYRTESGYTLTARRLTMYDSRLSGIDLHRPGNDELPTTIYTANEAEHSEDTGWTLLDGRMRVVHDDGFNEEYQFGRMRLGSFTERPRDLLDEPPEPDEMTYAELERSASILERSGGRFAPLLVKLHQRIAIPAATVVIVFFGVPLATSSKRGGTAYGIGAALGTTILYLLMFKVAGGFGESGAVPANLAAWSPNAIFLLAGAVLMVKVRT